MFRSMFWRPRRWLTMFQARMASGFQINAVNRMIHLLPERYPATSSISVSSIWGFDRWLFSSNNYKQVFVLMFHVAKYIGMKEMMAKQDAWERLLRASRPSSCWISGMISYGKIKYELLGGYKMQLKVPITKPSAVWKAHFCTHPSKGQKYCQWRYQRTYLLIFCLEVILYAQARNLVLSSLKAETAGCRNAAEGISENTWGDRETQGEGRSTSSPSITDKGKSCYPEVTVPVPVTWHDSEQAGPPPISIGKASGTLVNLE